jgi:uncharacterized protein YceK
MPSIDTAIAGVVSILVIFATRIIITGRMQVITGTAGGEGDGVCRCHATRAQGKRMDWGGGVLLLHSVN